MYSSFFPGDVGPLDGLRGVDDRGVHRGCAGFLLDHAYYIDEEYLETEEWSLDYYEYDGLDPGETVVRIENLTIGRDDLSGDYDTLADLLSTTYELYLVDTTVVPWADNTPELDVDLAIVDEVENSRQR